MRRIGEPRSYENCWHAESGGHVEAVVDPAELAGRRITDWDGYIAIDGAGDYTVYKEIGEIRVVHASGTATSPTIIDMDDTVRYIIEIMPAEGGEMRACVRVNFYG